MPESEAGSVAAGAMLPAEWMDRDDAGLKKSLGGDGRGLVITQLPLRCRPCYCFWCCCLVSGGGGCAAAAAASAESLVAAAATECRHVRR